MVTVSVSELKKLQKRVEAENRKKAKNEAKRFDGFGPHLQAKIRSAIRQVWQHSSHARKLCVKRAELPGGYSRCEKCLKKVPKTFIDHIVPMGALLSPGFLERTGVSSKGLQALCGPCHKIKTAQDKKSQIDFY